MSKFEGTLLALDTERQIDNRKVVVFWSFLFRIDRPVTRRLASGVATKVATEGMGPWKYRYSVCDDGG